MKNAQSGNALFYVLIAVCLLGALSYAVTQTTRGGGGNDLSNNRARLFATEIIETANSYASAVAQMRLRGVSPTQLCFDHTSWGGANYNYAACTDEQNKLFSPTGGGMNWSQAPAEAMNKLATPDNLWHFYGENEIANVGTTTGSASSSDLILMVDELTLSVCQNLNDLLGIAEVTDTPPTVSDYSTTRFVGTYGYTNTIGASTILAGKNAGCFEKTTAPAKYAFYKVLIAR